MLSRLKFGDRAVGKIEVDSGGESDLRELNRVKTDVRQFDKLEITVRELGVSQQLRRVRIMWVVVDFGDRQVRRGRRMNVERRLRQVRPFAAIECTGSNRRVPQYRDRQVVVKHGIGRNVAAGKLRVRTICRVVDQPGRGRKCYPKTERDLAAVLIKTWRIDRRKRAKLSDPDMGWRRGVGIQKRVRGP